MVEFFSNSKPPERSEEEPPFSPLGLLDLGRKALLCFNGTARALYKALNAVRCSRARWLARLDEPEPCVDASRDGGVAKTPEGLR